VPIDPDGVAEVNLSGELQQASIATLQRLSAQIVWTLRQVPGVTAVRLLDNGTPLTDVGVAGVQPAQSWRRFDPDVPPAAHGALVSDRGVVEGIGRGAPEALGHGRLSNPIISADGATVAAVRHLGRRMSLVVGPTIGNVHRRLTTEALSSPTFAPSGAVFVISGVGSVATVVEVPPTGQVRTVALPAPLSAQGVSAMAISRDGSRVAMTAGPAGHSSLVVGSLSVVHGTPTVVGVTTLVSETRDARGVAWANAGQIVTTARRTATHRAVFVTSIDGYRGHFIPTVGLPRDPDQVTASPGQPVLAVDHHGVFGRTDGLWRRVSTGRDPSYAG
jgi:hypothetical protein